MNAFDTMQQALNEAQDVQRAADAHATKMAKMLIGRLRHVEWRDHLRALKRELRDFDMVTGRWKQR